MNLFPLLATYPDLVVVFSEKKDGSCRLPQSDDPKTRQSSKENRTRFIKKLGLEEKNIVAAELVHSNAVYVASEVDRGTVIPETDALITRAPGIFLSVTVADCLPIFLFDPRTNSVGLIHAGWRGLANNIIPLTVQKMTSQLKCNPADIHAGVGPGIGNCHFEVKDDVLAKFTDFLPLALRRGNGRKYLDLKAIAQSALETAGLLPAHIDVSKECTFDLARKYFSYRRDKSEIPELIRKPASVATCRDFRAKDVQPDEGILGSIPRRDGRLATENIGVLAGCGASGQAPETMMAITGIRQK